MLITIPDIPRPEYRRITRAAFFKRFTDAEFEEIDYMSLDNAAESVAVRRAKARLRRVLRTLESMEFIDLDDARVRTWVTLMETRSLIAAGRAAQILDNPVQPEERL